MSATAHSAGESLRDAKVVGIKAHLRLHLELGRVSNLPTVWSNVFCGAVVTSSVFTAAHTPNVLAVACVMFAMSLFYIAGMYLNDACDATIDSEERPSRPIPSGRIKQVQVVLFTVLWFFTGWALLLLLMRSFVLSASAVLYGVIAAASLNGCIVLYDLFHKNNPASPIIMGLCRVLVVVTSYILMMSVISATNTSAIRLTSFHVSLLAVCALILVYLSGLTFIAKFENQRSVKAAWPIAALFVPVLFGAYASSNAVLTLIPTLMLAIAVVMAILYVRGRLNGGIPKAIGMLIAGISLIDAIVMSAHGSTLGMSFGVAAFFLTLLFQRKIAGT